MTTAPLFAAEPDPAEDIREGSLVVPVYIEEASLPELVRLGTVGLVEGRSLQEQFGGEGYNCESGNFRQGAFI